MMSTNQTLELARQRWLQDKHDEALDLFRQAHRASPNDIRLAIETASYLGMRFEIQEAAQILTDCEKLAGDNPRVWYQLGLAYQRAYRTDDSLRCLQQAIRDKKHALPALAIVEWYERRGRLDEANQLLEQIITDVGTDVPEVRLWKGKLLRQRGELDQAETEFRWIVNLDGDGKNNATRIAAWYGLAELSDRRDDSSQAIEAAKSAKRLQKPSVDQQLVVAKSLSAVETNFVSTVTAKHFASWQDQCQPEAGERASMALLTGPARSGTSMICRMLGMHGQLTVADEIEAYPTYVQPRMLAGRSGTSAAEILASLEEPHLDACRSLYRRWLSAALNRNVSHTALLDKFPSTTFLIPPFRRLFPNAVIVMAIRDPRDVVVSCFLRHLEINPVSAMFSSLDHTVARCCAEWKAWLVLREKLTTPWVEVRYEDIVRGEYGGLSEVHSLLGLKWEDRFAEFRDSLSESPVRSPTYAQLREPLSDKRIGRWRLYEEFLRPQLGVLNEYASKLGYEN